MGSGGNKNVHLNINVTYHGILRNYQPIKIEEGKLSRFERRLSVKKQCGVVRNIFEGKSNKGRIWSEYVEVKINKREGK